MVTTFQYPHILKAKDESGAWLEVAACRDEPNDKGSLVTVGDGSQHQFSSLVFMDLGADELFPGQDIQVLEENGDVRLKGEVKRFSEDSLHCRLWV